MLSIMPKSKQEHNALFYQRHKERIDARNLAYYKENQDVIVPKQTASNKQRRRRYMEEARQSLGGKCVKCGTTEQLEFNHILPGTKHLQISQVGNGGMDNWRAEIKKCELLCKPCHKELSDIQRNTSWALFCALPPDIYHSLMNGDITPADIKFQV